MKNKYYCNPVNKYLDISKLDLEKWKRAGALLGLGLDGNLTLLEKPNYTDEGNGKEALFDDGKYRKVYTIDEVDKLLKDLNISGDASIKEVSDALSKFQSSQEAINTELHNKDVAQDKRMDELVKDISTNTANIKGTDSKVETNKVDIQYIKDNYLNKDNVNTLASKEEVKAVKDITEVNRGLIDNNRKDINSLLEGEDSYTHFRGLFDTIDNLKIVTFPKVNDFAYVEETHTKWQFTVDHKWVDTKNTYPRDTRNASKAEFDESIKESNEALEKAVNELNENKVDKTVYEEDLASLEEYKESQSELNAKQDIDINKNLQNINQLNDMIKVLSQKDEPIMSANGGGVINLPNNAMKSVAPRYKFEGLTLQNLDINGYKEEIAPNSNVRQLPIGRVGDLMYVRADVFVNKGGYLNHSIGGKIETGINKGVINKYTPYSIKTKVEELKHFFIGNDGKNQSKTKNRIIINLTQMFGAGNEPTKEWCDEHITGYFEGVKSVQTPMRIKSDVGRRNLFIGGKKINVKNFTELIKFPEFLKKDINYTIHFNILESNTNTGFLMYLFDDIDQTTYQKFILTKKMGKEGFVFTPTVDLHYIRLYASNAANKEATALYENIKIEEGTVATPWTPAPEDNLPPQGGALYINNQLELKSVGTTKDYIEDGKLYKNIGYIDDLSKVPVFSFTKVNDVNILALNFSSIRGGIKEFARFMTSPFIDQSQTLPKEVTKDDIGKINTSNYFNNNIISYYADSSDTKEDILNRLSGVQFYYILRTPEIINLNTSGLITNHPNGTIFLEPIINVTLFYNDGLDVSKFNIESVEEFAIFKDGNYQNLDISKIKITDNKLTHPDAINGLCYLVFRYDNNPIFGDNEVEYYNNDGILVSPDGTFWKPVLTVDDEGNVLMKGEKL